MSYPSGEVGSAASPYYSLCNKINMQIKEVLRKIHLVLGLASGLVIFIVSLTGALYVFQDEVALLLQGYKKVEPQQQEFIAPSEAFLIGKETIQNRTIHGLVYGTPDEALEIIYYQTEPEFYGFAYLNPYSGKVIETLDYNKTFFGIMLKGHTSLWLPEKIGLVIIAAAIIIFLSQLITGLVLWWPRKRASSKSFGFSTEASSSVKRLELHKVVGFYVFWLALIFVLTGMVWLFQGFERGIFKSLGGEKEIVFSYPESDTTFKGKETFEGHPVDNVYDKIKKEYPEMPVIEIHTLDNPLSPVFVELNRDPSTYWKMDYLFFDQYTLEEIPPSHAYGRYNEAGLPEKVRRLNYDVHAGSIGGFLGKLLAFIASIFCASLPVTGFIIWWQRTKEKKMFLNKMDI